MNTKSTTDAVTMESRDGQVMSKEDAELVLKTIYRPDTRFTSMGGVNSDIAKSNAVERVVKLASEGMSINNLEAFATTVRTRAHYDIARKMMIKEVDQRGKVCLKARVFSGDASTGDDDGSNIFGGLVSTNPTPAEEGERGDMREFLAKIDVELAKLPKHKSDVFRMVAYCGCSYLDVARVVFHAEVKDSDADSRKKIYQNRIACIVDRVRRKLIAACGERACELGVLSQKRLRKIVQ